MRLENFFIDAGWSEEIWTICNNDVPKLKWNKNSCE
jgi:hypothetical protein